MTLLLADTYREWVWVVAVYISSSSDGHWLNNLDIKSKQKNHSHLFAVHTIRNQLICLNERTAT